MKRFATFCFLAFAVVLLLTNGAMAQSGASVDSPTGVPGFKFTDLPQVYVEGALTFDYFVTTSPVVPIVNENNTAVLGSGSGYGVAGPGGNLTIYIPPQASGSVTVTVKGDIDGSEVLVPLVSFTRDFGGGPKTPTSVLLASSANPAPYGDQMTFTATVTGSGGTPTGTVTFKVGTSAGTDVGLTNGIATFDREGLLSVGTHTITASYSGDGAFDGSSSTLDQTVNTKALSIADITASSKVYDGTTDATYTGTPSLQGVVYNETVTVVGTPTVAFDTKNAGTGKIVTVSGFTLGGAHAGNYTLTQPTLLSANITPKELTVTGITASDKTYDGNANATLITGTPALVEPVSGDAVTLSAGDAIGKFDNKNQGTNKPVTVSGLTITGGDAANYTLAEPKTTASIFKAPASVVPAANGKTYGTPEPALTGSITGFVQSDGIGAIYSRTSGETVGQYTTSATLSPAGALDNYDINYGTAAFTITKATASVTPNAATKLYGAPDPPLTGTLAGFVAADNVTAAFGRTSGEPVGQYTISATLSPTTVLPNYDITYNTANFTITTNTTTTALTTSAATSVYGQSVNFTGTVTGSSGGPPTGTVDFKDGTTSLGTGTLSAGVATLSISTLAVGTHSITAVYGGDANFAGSTSSAVTQTITDATTNTGSVAGAGLISSPAGAYVSKPTFTGKGYFVFAVGYVKNNPLPIGLTTFVLKSNSLFSSTAFSFSSLKHESLVFSGAQATFTGTGKVNGSGNYGFLLSVLDGHATKTSDKLRIKIWNKNQANAVFYDSQMGAADDASPTATVTGGVITITKSGGSSTAMDMSIEQLMEDEAAAAVPTEYALHNAYPNPFNPSTTIGFDLPEAAKVRLAVYDMLGREVAVLADEERPAGQHSVRFDAGKLSSGMYIFRLQAGSFTQTKKLMLMK